MAEGESKSRPILFSAPMVKALLAGTKTQTRRIIKPRGGASLFSGQWDDSYVLDPGNADWRGQAYPWCVGDTLWVKETWRTGAQFDHLPPRELDPMYAAPIGYCADEAPGTISRTGKTRVSIFMPRWASRILLRVTDVRVERLQAISRDDAKAEGVPEFWDQAERLGLPGAADDNGHVWDNHTTVENYRSLWEHINGAGSWDANPWVVAITFERLPDTRGRQE